MQEQNDCIAVCYKDGSFAIFDLEDHEGLDYKLNIHKAKKRI
jgi:hypothetical protein